MKFSFNYFKDLETPDFYLCNPNGTELYLLHAYDRVFTLRFNDLSTLTFKVPSTITTSEGVIIYTPYYDLVRTKRLISVKDVGSFFIKSVYEYEDETICYKEVTAESCQASFKDRSVATEERIYRFYNPNDPYDSTYDDKDLSAIPSVIGQLYQQLGILKKSSLDATPTEPSDPYNKWTITYISSNLYSGDGVFRSFTKKSSTGYEWMISDVSEAFGVIFVFDILNKAIQIKMKSEVAEMSNVIMSLDNFVESLDVNEDADNIVTVLSCEGSGTDISLVNPTGTKYIVDFSYYMDEATHKWMSPALIAKIKQWQADVTAAKSGYTNSITSLRGFYQHKLEREESLKHISMLLKDLKNARDNSIKEMVGMTSLSGIVLAETVAIGEKSKDAQSAYKNTAFGSSQIIVGYSDPPSYSNGVWTFSGIGTIASAETNYANHKYYFIDEGSNATSYCKLVGSMEVNTENDTSSEVCTGFKRFTDYSKAKDWVVEYDKQVATLNNQLNTINNNIKSLINTLETTSSSLNIRNYFSNTPALWDELECYWIEGSYTNNNIAVLDTTTIDEEIDLAYELLDAGEIELSYVSQPHYSFSVKPSSAIMQYEFREQLNDLILGNIVAVEKTDGVIFYPLLLELQIGLDNNDEFSMSFANATRLDDWGYTYADLINSAAGTTRQVSANWTNINSYAKEKVSLVPLIQNPLDTTLRAAIASTKNQSFIVDDTGILGRQKIDNSGNFDDEQLRIINNMLIFTDDSWNTAKAALGKISYLDGDGHTQSAYGLIADTIIGSFIVGEKLMITNQSSSFLIDGGGMKINVGTSQNPSYSTVNSLITQTASEIIAEVSNSISNVSSSVSQLANSISLVVDSSNNSIKAASIVAAINNDTSSVTLSADKINLNGVVSANGKFLIDTYGNMACTGGNIGGISINSSGISAGSATTVITPSHPVMRANINGDTVTYNSSGWYNWVYQVTSGDTYVISTLSAGSSRIELHYSYNDPYITTGAITMTSHSSAYYSNSTTTVTIKIPSGVRYITINKNNSSSPTVSNVVGGGAFTLSSGGELTCLKANITGTINATEGTIGAWDITPYGIRGTTGTENFPFMQVDPTGITCYDPLSPWIRAFDISPIRLVFRNYKYASLYQDLEYSHPTTLHPLYITDAGLVVIVQQQSTTGYITEADMYLQEH